MRVHVRVLAAVVLIAFGVLWWTGCSSADGTVTSYVGVSHGWGYGYGPGWGHGYYPGGFYPGGGVIIGPPRPTPY